VAAIGTAGLGDAAPDTVVGPGLGHIAALEPNGMPTEVTAGHMATGVPRRLYSASEMQRALEGESRDGCPTVLMFGSKACRTCRVIQPKMEKLTAKAGATFLFMHHDASTNAIFSERAVTHTPTVEIYNGRGVLVERAVYAPSDLSRLSSVLDGMMVGIDHKH